MKSGGASLFARDIVVSIFCSVFSAGETWVEMSSDLHLASLDKYSSRYPEWRLADNPWQPAHPSLCTGSTVPHMGRHIWSRLFKPMLLRFHMT